MGNSALIWHLWAPHWSIRRLRSCLPLWRSHIIRLKGLVGYLASFLASYLSVRLSCLLACWLAGWLEQANNKADEQTQQLNWLVTIPLAILAKQHKNPANFRPMTLQAAGGSCIGYNCGPQTKVEHKRSLRYNSYYIFCAKLVREKSLNISRDFNRFDYRTCNSQRAKVAKL